MDRNYQKVIENYEKEQRKYAKAKEKEIELLNSKVSGLEKNLIELEMKNRELMRELDVARHNESKTSTLSFEESLKNNELKATILLQKNEIEDLKRNNDEMINRYLEENQRLKEKLEVNEDKLVELRNLQNENEKYKSKMKEMQKLKEKISDYENLMIIIESKSKSIESLQNEKKTLLLNLEKLQKDLIGEKDKLRAVEFEKRKLEMDLKEARNLAARLENRLDNQLKRKDSVVRSA